MSTPTDPAGSDDARESVPASPDAPTAASPEIPASPDAPTAAYPADVPAAPPVPPAPADGTPAAPAYAAAPAPGAPPQAPYGQAPYGQPSYGQPAYAAAPSGPDTRPKTLAWISLGLAVLGVILSCIGFVPVPWVGLVSVIVGGLLLLIAFVLSIIALASRKQGGKPFSIIALVVAVLGGGLWAVALFVSIALTAITSSSSTGESLESPAPSVSVAPSEDGTDGEAPAGAYDEAAFLAEARPAILAVFQEVEPSVTEDLVNQMFPDDALIAAGQSMLLLGDAGRGTMIDSLTEGGTFDDDTAGRFVDAIYDAASKHLQE
jgi:hypothetical protein